ENVGRTQRQTAPGPAVVGRDVCGNVRGHPERKGRTSQFRESVTQTGLSKPTACARSLAVLGNDTGLAFRELEAFTRPRLPGFLAFFHPGIPSQQSIGLERG